jgi:hypothetical protein
MPGRPLLVAVRLVDDESDGDIVTVDFEMTTGSLRIMAEVHAVGRTVHASAFRPRSLPWTCALDWLGDDYDELVIKGAVRTSGANPGRRPGDLRFTRRVRPASDTS